MNAKGAHATTRRREGGGFLLGLFLGLLAGLAIAIGVAWYLHRTPAPFVERSKPTAGAEPGAPGAIAGLPQAGDRAETDKPRYDFYRVLPGSEAPVSDRELKEAARAAKGAPGPAADVYFIQAGSFQNPADADGQKARLALLGLDASVEPTTLPEKGTWYRVRIGPYTRIDELDRVRQLLAQNGIDANLVKAKAQ